MVDVAGRKWKKMKVGHKMDELNNEKMDKWRRNGSNRIDNTIIERDYNCHQLKVFEKKISARWRRWKRSE